MCWFKRRLVIGGDDVAQVIGTDEFWRYATSYQSPNLPGTVFVVASYAATARRASITTAVCTEAIIARHDLRAA
jgi:hypothetical protein